MRNQSRASILVPVITGVLLAVALIALVIVSARKPSPKPPGGPRPTPSSTITPDERRPGSGRITPSHPPPEAWGVPKTTDPRRLTEAFARAIWTYDTATHTWEQWRQAVDAFADPSALPAVGEVARSMLPLWQQWEETVRRGGRGGVVTVKAVVTPELDALSRDPRAPAGWHGYWVRGDVVTVADGRSSLGSRQATVAVVCAPNCRFWSASAETPQ